MQDSLYVQTSIAMSANALLPQLGVKYDGDNDSTQDMGTARRRSMLRHTLLPEAVDQPYLAELFPVIVAAFAPQVVKYSNTNPDIKKSDGSHGERIDWKASSYMEVDRTTPGAAQRGVAVNQALLKVCTPLLEKCNACFASWYKERHGAGSIHTLVRLQSFITRYRPLPNENALLRHIDGAHVDGSVVLALPTPHPFQGGGLTVWEPKDSAGPSDPSESPAGPAGCEEAPGGEGTARGCAASTEEEAFHYPMPPGDMCLLDNYVWHQGNPITAGERWSLVIFYSVKPPTTSRILSIVKKAADDVRRRQGGRPA